MKKQRLELQQGVRYRGYGYINDFGEFEFTPEQTGSRQGRRKLIKEGDCFTISETSSVRIFHLTIPKKYSGVALIKEFLTIMNKIVCVLRDYEI